jgi:Flp pilus assembly CpaF family ATPase
MPRSELDALAIEAWREVVAELGRQRELAAETGARLDDLAEKALGHELAVGWLDALARRRLTAGDDSLGEDDEDYLLEQITARLHGLGVLDLLRQEPDVENIVANGCDTVWVYRTGGRIEPGPPVATSDDELVELVRNAAARLGRSERRFDTGNPFVDLRLPDGSRLQAAMAVSDRPAVSVRVHRHQDVTLDDLVALGTLDKALHGLLASAVKARMSMIIVGGTDAGKTTLMRGCIHEIDPLERLVTIEDRVELSLAESPRHLNVVEFETRPPNIEGEGEITMQRLVKEALSMRPDRLIVGEVRGPEVIDMLVALSIGNDGSLCTLHANSTASAFRKIATYALRSAERLPPSATARMVADSIDFVVHVRKHADGRRVVESVRQVVGAEGEMVESNEIFAPDHMGRARPAAQIRTDTLERLIAAGFDEDLLHNPSGWWET